jgi:hypothetical protein
MEALCTITLLALYLLFVLKNSSAFLLKAQTISGLVLAVCP